MHLLIGSIALFAAVTVITAAESAYLPRLGPPALRFESPKPEPEMPPTPLPPLDPRPALAITNVADSTSSDAIATPAPATNAAEKPATPASTPTPEITPEAESSPTAPRPGLAAPPLEPALTGRENLTPQMFMKFFTGRPETNSANSSVTVFAPLPFVPPVPLTPPSSSASYQTTPAPVPAPAPASAPKP